MKTVGLITFNTEARIFCCDCEEHDKCRKKGAMDKVRGFEKNGKMDDEHTYVSSHFCKLPNFINEMFDELKVNDKFPDIVVIGLQESAIKNGVGSDQLLQAINRCRSDFNLIAKEKVMGLGKEGSRGTRIGVYANESTVGVDADFDYITLCDKSGANKSAIHALIKYNDVDGSNKTFSVINTHLPFSGKKRDQGMSQRNTEFTRIMKKFNKESNIPEPVSELDKSDSDDEYSEEELKEREMKKKEEADNLKEYKECSQTWGRQNIKNTLADTVFFMGDLNYRLTTELNPPATLTAEQKADIRAEDLKLVDKIFAGKYDELKEHDQLRFSMKQGQPLNVFNFKEGELDNRHDINGNLIDHNDSAEPHIHDANCYKGPQFMPTCKLQKLDLDTEIDVKGLNSESRGTNRENYELILDVDPKVATKKQIEKLKKGKRMPSFCDRILYKTSESFSVKCTHYNRFEFGNTKISDHTPVVGVYEIGNKSTSEVSAPAGQKRKRDEELLVDEEENEEDPNSKKTKLKGGSLMDLQNEYNAIRNKYILLKNNIPANHNLI